MRTSWRHLRHILTFQFRHKMKEIKAAEGYYLTQSAEVADSERTYITAIKGVNVNESDWREATDSEKEAFEKAQEDARKTSEDEEQ